MRRALRAAALMVGFALFGACGTHVAYLPTNSPPHQLLARSPDQVEVFTAARPDRPYVEIGLVEAQQEVYSGDAPEEVFRRLRIEAGRHGCEGLILLGGNDAVVANMGPYGGGAQTLRGYRATCIVWKGTAPDSSAQPATPAPPPSL